MAKKNDARLGQGLSEIFGMNIDSVLEDIQQGKSELSNSSEMGIPPKLLIASTITCL